MEPGETAAFEAVYGAGGEWARFFAGGDGYLGTELLWGSDGAVARRRYVRERTLGRFDVR